MAEDVILCTFVVAPKSRLKYGVPCVHSFRATNISLVFVKVAMRRSRSKPHKRNAYWNLGRDVMSGLANDIARKLQVAWSFCLSNLGLSGQIVVPYMEKKSVAVSGWQIPLQLLQCTPGRARPNGSDMRHYP